MSLISALAAGVRVLERTYEERQQRPKQAMPAVTTPPYLRHVQALFSGDWEAACAHAEHKLLDLTQ